jgi:autophagy-related protein 101
MIELPIVEAGPHQLREILRCLIHTIVFNRTLGYVKPRDVDSELFDITYVKCDDPEIEAKVETSISDICSSVDRRPADHAVQLCLAFYELRKKAAWFGSKDERLYWEQWFIKIQVLSTVEQQQHGYNSMKHLSTSKRQLKQQATLQHALGEVLRMVNEKRDHIPPLSSLTSPCFPFDIVGSGGSKTGFGANIQAVKKILQTTPPMMLN